MEGKHAKRLRDELLTPISRMRPPLKKQTERVRDFCIQRGYSWDASAARHVVGQQEYYDDLLARYLGWGRVRSGD